ncbi:hypothetical protein HK098_001357 [Nowakowskiella sp. JEL0407]|nr:hypothetical protein HK098_001357 [Nowakowskiella sp. JEL0407]
MFLNSPTQRLSLLSGDCFFGLIRNDLPEKINDILELIEDDDFKRLIEETWSKVMKRVLLLPLLVDTHGVSGFDDIVKMKEEEEREFLENVPDLSSRPRIISPPKTQDTPNGGNGDDTDANVKCEPILIESDSEVEAPRGQAHPGTTKFGDTVKSEKKRERRAVESDSEDDEDPLPRARPCPFQGEQQHIGASKDDNDEDTNANVKREPTLVESDSEDDEEPHSNTIPTVLRRRFDVCSSVL